MTGSTKAALHYVVGPAQVVQGCKCLRCEGVRARKRFRLQLRAGHLLRDRLEAYTCLPWVRQVRNGHASCSVQYEGHKLRIDACEVQADAAQQRLAYKVLVDGELVNAFLWEELHTVLNDVLASLTPYTEQWIARVRERARAHERTDQWAYKNGTP